MIVLSSFKVSGLQRALRPQRYSTTSSINSHSRYGTSTRVAATLGRNTSLDWPGSRQNVEQQRRVASREFSTLALTFPSFARGTQQPNAAVEALTRPPVGTEHRNQASSAHLAGPMLFFQEMVRSSQLQNDPHQLETMAKLQHLFENLVAHRKVDLHAVGSPGALFPVKGLYMYGGVGTGKTMMMDLFFGSVTHLKRKKRIHFHAFMADVHQRIHNLRQTNGARDVMPELIVQLANEATLLCFDEFQVTDVADAMILKRLFEGLLQAGVVVVATSNRPPNDLYKGGLNRELFLPFIELLKKHCTVHHMKSVNDYRLTGSRTSSVYYSPLNSESSKTLDDIFNMLTEGHQAAPTEVMVLGRAVDVPLAAKGVARFSFSELCERPLAAVDFMAIAKEFHTILLSDIPRLSWNERDKLRRFIILIDVLYEYKVKVVCSAAAPAQQLFIAESVPTPNAGPASTSMENVDEHFAFDRTVSRLMEMQTTEYLQQQHTVLVNEKHAHQHHKLHHQ